jgi:hypothetical protein
LFATWLGPVLSSLSGQQDAAVLVGRVEGTAYVSPTGVFRVQIPVLPELGGTITDTETVVTFQDAFTIHESIACFRLDATQRWEHETRGRRDYLIWFFSNFVQSDFEQRFPGAQIESAHFLPSVRDGSLLTYNLLPGGSMFAEKIILTGNELAPVAKRGNLLFVHNSHIFVLSIELAEKILERSHYSKTVADEDAILRRRLLALLDKVSFSAGPELKSAKSQ